MRKGIQEVYMFMYAVNSSLLILLPKCNGSFCCGPRPIESLWRPSRSTDRFEKKTIVFSVCEGARKKPIPKVVVPCNTAQFGHERDGEKVLKNLGDGSGSLLTQTELILTHS